MNKNEAMEPIAENTPAPKKKGRKRIPLVGIIALCLAGVIVLGVIGAGGFVLIKLGNMSRNAVSIVKPTVAPVDSHTAPPVELVPIEGDPDDLTEDFDVPLDSQDVYPDPIYQENQKDPNVINILLMGDDGRDSYDSGRSDAMMILSYNTKTNAVKIVSLLRDIWIYIPGRDKWNRINTAYRFGGVGLAINTINVNFGMDIQYYMLVHFSDLVAITDKLGGIDVYLTEREAQFLNQYSSSPTLLQETDGVQHLDGVQVFCHSRNRSLGNGDWSRTERQRAVMTAFFDRAKQEKDAAALASLMFSLMDYVETNMSPWQMISIGTSIVFGDRSVAPQKATLPCAGSWTYAYEDRKAVIHIDIEQNKLWLHEYLYGNDG